MTQAHSEEARYRALLELSPRAEGALVRLLEGLHDESWRVRKAAVEQLARVPEPDAVAARLIAVLGERGQTGARNSAAEALVRLGSPAVPGLVDLLAHPDPDQRKFAADILGELRRPSTVPALLAALQQPDPNVQLSAAEALGRVGGEEAGRALEEVLRTHGALLQLAALEGLYACGRVPPLAVLEPLLGSPQLRRSAYRLLGTLAEPAAVDLACRGLASPGASVRGAALAALWTQRAALGAPRREELLEVIRATLKDVDVSAALEGGLGASAVEIRGGALLVVAALRHAPLARAVVAAATEEALCEEATRALLALKGEGTAELLRQLPSLPAPTRGALAGVLVELADASMVQALCGLVHAAEPDLRPWAVRALGRTRAASAVAPLAQLLPDKELGFVAARGLVTLAGAAQGEVAAALAAVEEPVPPAAALARALLAGPAGLALLRPLAGHPEGEVRAQAATAAGELSPDALPVLSLALADELPLVRRAAVRALGNLPRDGVAPALALALGDEDEGVRRAAVEAAGVCRCVEVAPALAALVSGEAGVASAAVRALGQMGRFSAELLQQAGRHRDPEVLKAALGSAAGLTQAVPLSLALLRHPRWDVRSAAARALGATAGLAELEAVRAARRQEADPLVQVELEAAAAALGRREGQKGG